MEEGLLGLNTLTLSYGIMHQAASQNHHTQYREKKLELNMHQI